MRWLCFLIGVMLVIYSLVMILGMKLIYLAVLLFGLAMMIVGQENF